MVITAKDQEKEKTRKENTENGIVELSIILNDVFPSIQKQKQNSNQFVLQYLRKNKRKKGTKLI